MSVDSKPVEAQWVKENRIGRQLVAILAKHCGERGDNEGAVETLHRIIRERGLLGACLWKTLGGPPDHPNGCR